MNREESLDNIVIDSYTISDLASLIFPAYDLETGEREPKKYLVSWSGWPIGSSPTYEGAKDIIENHRKEELRMSLTQDQIDEWVDSEGYYNGVESETRVANMTTTDMVREFAEVTGQEPDEYLYATLMDEEYKEWQAADSDEEELKELADLVYVVFGYANAKGYDLETAVRRVHENNLGRIKQPDGTIQRRADGKILKNKDYPKVDLSDLTGSKGEST